MSPETVAATGVTPAAIAADASGTLYVMDSASHAVIAYPVSGASFTAATGLVMPTGLAFDGIGNVYSADASQTAVQLLARSAVSVNFGSSTTATQALSLSNVAATAFAQSGIRIRAITRVRWCLRAATVWLTSHSFPIMRCITRARSATAKRWRCGSPPIRPCSTTYILQFSGHLVCRLAGCERSELHAGAAVLLEGLCLRRCGLHLWRRGAGV